jgi:hypothetical protein
MLWWGCSKLCERPIRAALSTETDYQLVVELPAAGRQEKSAVGNVSARPRSLYFDQLKRREFITARRRTACVAPRGAGAIIR